MLVNLESCQKIYFNVMLFSNPWDKDLIQVKSTGHI